ncbi:5671_t:CDS:1, partial [Paraglomus occultum]
KKLAKVQQREEKLTNTKKQHIQRIDNLTIKLDQVRQILGQENQELRDKLQKLQLRQDSGYWDDEYEVDLEPKNFDRTTQTKIITFSSQETQADLVVEPDQEILSRLNRQQKEITELKNYVLVLEKDFLDAANKNELLEQWYYELEALIRKQDQDLSNLDQLIDSKNERLTTTQKKKE